MRKWDISVTGCVTANEAPDAPGLAYPHVSPGRHESWSGCWQD